MQWAHGTNTRSTQVNTILTKSSETNHTKSEGVQEKFRQLYSIPVIAVQRLSFEGVVLEFIKLIQSALVIFDLFDFIYDRDGLLCDTLVDSIQRWTLEIGENLEELGLEVR